MVTLSNRFKKGSNTEFTVHFYLECKKGSKQICTNLKSGCNFYTSATYTRVNKVIRKTTIMWFVCFNIYVLVFIQLHCTHRKKQYS